MASPVEICNSALIKLGVEPITSLSQDNKQARLCNEQYEKIRDKLLESHYWNFAEKREELAVVSGGTPLFGFALKYQLPADCLRAKHLNVKTARFKIEQGRFLHTNVSSAKLLYIAKITDVSKYSSMFKELLAVDLAIDLCMALTQKRTLKADLKDERKELLRDARSSDGQEGTNDMLMDDEWLNSRIGDPTGDYSYDESI